MKMIWTSYFGNLTILLYFVGLTLKHFGLSSISHGLINLLIILFFYYFSKIITICQPLQTKSFMGDSPIQVQQGSTRKIQKEILCIKPQGKKEGLVFVA